MDLYTSTLFRYNLLYAHSLTPDAIYILSAKYGLVSLNSVIDTYDLTLNNMKTNEIKNWAEKVVESLREKHDLTSDKFIILAGNNYRKFIIPKLSIHEIPMKGKKIGEQLQWLKMVTSCHKTNVATKKGIHQNLIPKSNYSLANKTANDSICQNLHCLFRALPRYSFPFISNTIPENGIYILFEKNEQGHDGDRIVRVGTHTGENQLLARLTQHFINPNKDRSIFRKNIGRALLNQKNDPYLEKWEWDLTTVQKKIELEPFINKTYQEMIENRVTEYIQKNFTFCVFKVDDPKYRKQIEAQIISTISECTDCKPSTSWFGGYSPKAKIKKSGLWQVNELNKPDQIMTEESFNQLVRNIIKPK